MAVRRNRYYSGAYQSDPNLARGFDNIAKMFAPPGGADLLGYVKARQARDEMVRMQSALEAIRSGRGGVADFIAAGVSNPATQYGVADMYRLATQNPDPRALDSRGYAIHGNASNTFMGLGIKESGDTQRKAMDVQGALDRQMLAPVGQGQTRFVPPDIAQQFNVPETQSGTLEMDQGKQYLLPDGKVASGPAKPLSESEMKAIILGRQPEEIQNQTVRSAIPVEKVEDATGVGRFAFRGDAVGQPAYEKPPAERAQNFVAPGGQRGITYDGGRTDATGAPLPPGVVLSSPMAGVGESALGPTKTNITAANSREAELRRTRGTLDLYEGLLTNNPGAVGLPGLIRGTAQNAMQVASDMARSFGKDVPQVQEAADQIRTGLSKVDPGLFDTSIPEAQFLQGTLAYAIARTENPSGEVSRQAYDRALERIRGGYLQNSTSSLAAVGAMRKVLEQEEKAITSLRGQSAPAQAPSGPPDANQSQSSAPQEQPPVPGARRANDGNWYVPDPARPGKYLMVQP